MNTIIIMYRIPNRYAVKGQKIRKGAKISLTAAAVVYKGTDIYIYMNACHIYRAR